jgi:electron transfer flavoprotein alpha subunit
MQKAIYEGQAKGEVVYPEVAKYVPEVDYVVKVLDRHVEAAKHNLKGASIVVSGGYGVGSKRASTCSSNWPRNCTARWVPAAPPWMPDG